MEIPLILVRQYLKNKGATNVPHVKQGSLLDHFNRVAEMLGSWNLPSAVVRAGIAHSIYSTSHFPSELVSASNRDEIATLLGEEAERVVWLYGRLDRPSLSFTDGRASYVDRLTKERVFISNEDFSALLHILLANDLDHVESSQFEETRNALKEYMRFDSFLAEKAIQEIQRMQPFRSAAGENFISFIGHSGIWVSTEKQSLVVDPWLYSSSLNQPHIKGLKPGQRALDYLIPRPTHTSRELSPDIVLLSHFHTHHSPVRELIEFATHKPITVVCPELTQKEQDELRAAFSNEIYANITFNFLSADTTFTIGEFTIYAFKHLPNHYGFHVTSKRGSFIHLADAIANHDSTRLNLQDSWNRITNTNPDFFFLTAANHIERTMKNLKRDLIEHASLSPTQAAKLTRLVGAKRVGLIGMFNFSIWDSAQEYTHSSQDIENEFAWAMSYLEPSIEILTMRPGVSFPF